jgi:hypothetical protein
LRGSGSAARRALAWIAAAAAIAAGGWLVTRGAGALRAVVESPETGIRRALSKIDERAPRAVTGVDATLRLERIGFKDLLVTAGDGGARVVAVADAEGSVIWRGQEVGLSYVGRERILMIPCREQGWCRVGEPAPRLASLLALLVRRAAAFDAADSAAYRELVAADYRGPDGGRAALLGRLAADLTAEPRARFRPIAWQIRIERDAAQVGEDYELRLGAGPARRLRARLDLRDEGGRWWITGGL